MTDDRTTGAPRRSRKRRNADPEAPATEEPTETPTEEPTETPTMPPTITPNTPQDPAADPLSRLMDQCAADGANVAIVVCDFIGSPMKGFDPIPGDAFDPSGLAERLPPGTYKLRTRTPSGLWRGSTTFRIAAAPNTPATAGPPRDPYDAAPSAPPAPTAPGVSIDTLRGIVRDELRAIMPPQSRGGIDWSHVPAIASAISALLAAMKPAESITLRDLIPLLKTERPPVQDMIEALGTLDTLRGDPPGAPASSAESETMRMLAPLIGEALRHSANPRGQPPPPAPPVNTPRALRLAPAGASTLPPGATRDQTATARVRPDTRPEEAPPPPDPLADATSSTADATDGGAAGFRAAPLPEPSRDDSIGRAARILADGSRRLYPEESIAAFIVAEWDSGAFTAAVLKRGIEPQAIPEITQGATPTPPQVEALADLFIAQEPELLGSATARAYTQRVAEILADEWAHEEAAA